MHPQVKFSPRFLSLPASRGKLLIAPRQQWFFENLFPPAERGDDYVTSIFELSFVFYKFLWIDMSKLLVLANSSGWKMNLKCCYSFPFPYVPKNKNTYIPYRFYKNCKVLRKIIWGAKKGTGLTIEKMFVQTFALIQPWKRMD